MFVAVVLNSLYPLQQFLAVGIGWMLSGILTAAGVFTDDPTSIGFKARTDARADVITKFPYIFIPYPRTCTSSVCL